MVMKAPYRFIPVSGFVHEPKWKGETSIDAPLEDGVSGWLEVAIEAKSEFLIGGTGALRQKRADGTHVYFNETPDGAKAIPGSSLRGMLRSVLEIAAFGRAAFIENTRFGVRDLTRGGRQVYQSRLVEPHPGGRVQGLPASRPRSRAGWLKKVRDPGTGQEKWLLQACDFARIAVAELEKIQPGVEINLRPGGDAGGVAARYRAWTAPTAQRLAVSGRQFHPRVFRPAHPGGAFEATAALEYAEATLPPAGTQGVDGHIVFTGKPATGLHFRPTDPNGQRQYYGKKKHEFFFHSRSPDWVDVTSLKLDFLDVHDERPGKPASGSWQHWKEPFSRGEEVPVFFIAAPDGTSVEAMGLAMMFKLAHRLRTRDLLTHAAPAHVDLSIQDIPTLLFGPALEEQAQAFKGRVSCETFQISGTAREAPPRTVILSSPKGQFFQALVKQPDNGQGRLVGDYNAPYASYTPLDAGALEVRRPEIAGRKRYPSRPGIGQTPLVAGADMQTILHALLPGARFTGRIRYHNLKPEELGALVFAINLWASNWGERPADLRHRLGMGKSLGLGDVTLTITDASLEPNQLANGARQIIRGTDAVREVDRCSALFSAHMTSAFEKAREQGSAAVWRASEQIELLLSMADPKMAEGADLTYMSLAEHLDAKRDQQVLAPYPRRAANQTGQSPGKLSDSQVFLRDATVANAGGAPAQAHVPAATPTTARRRVLSLDVMVDVLGPGSSPGKTLVRFDDEGPEDWSTADLGDA